ncbi:MAG: hypothetical protein JO031_03445 [Ktedonobacteraceae bacterium]|nr:hypothetical protein [Ktedonobacteraceae bacterium]
MLHKIAPPAYVGQLERILDFQQQLLTFACDNKTVLPLDKMQILATFGNDKGQWLIERLMTSQGKLWKFGEELQNFISHMQAHPSEGPKIVAAFENDRQFHCKLNDPLFEFQYRKLAECARKYLASLMISFYEKLLKSGFPPCIHGGQPGLLKRSQLVKGFSDANCNLKVCPGCDGPRTRPGDGDEDEDGDEEGVSDDENEDKEKDLSDIDHFFPKSLYPFFAMHPFNLVPLCTDCNEKVKKQKDPLELGDQGKEVLSRTFLPFVNPAVPKIEVCVFRNENGKRIISIHDKEQANSPRVRNLDRVFKLKRYWNGRLDRMIDLMDYQLTEARKHEKLTKDPVNDEIVKQKLSEHLADYDNKVGCIEYLLIHGGYAKFALNDLKELADLTAFLLKK